MPFVFGIILNILIGYVFGGLIIILMPILFLGYLAYMIGKPFIQEYFEKRKQRKKLKKFLEKRLNYLP